MSTFMKALSFLNSALVMSSSSRVSPEHFSHALPLLADTAHASFQALDAVRIDAYIGSRRRALIPALTLDIGVPHWPTHAAVPVHANSKRLNNAKKAKKSLLKEAMVWAHGAKAHLHQM